MKKRTSDQSAKINPPRYFLRKTISIYAIILTLFLIFTQSGIAVTGTVAIQELEGFE